MMTPVPGRRISRNQVAVFVGVCAAAVLLTIVHEAGMYRWITDPHVLDLLGYLAAWIPLAAVAVAVRSSLLQTGRIRWTARPMDVLWGLGIGLICRSIVGIIEIIGYGHIGSAPVTLGPTIYDSWWLFATVLAPVILAPVIEELFFRGVVLDAWIGNRAAVRLIISAGLFALLHLVQVTSAASALVIGSSTFIFGLAVAAVTLYTGRLGGAIIAHIMFNALAVVPTLL